MNKIISQGEYDGACFLYSAANAFRTLTGKRPTQKRWNEIFKWIPFAEDFITDNGTIRYDDSMELYQFAIERIFSCFGPSHSFEIKPIPNIDSPSKLKQLIRENSVLILNIESEHWVVCVDADKDNVYAACSDQLRIQSSNYTEYVSGHLSRNYNLVMEMRGHNWVHNPSVFQITKLEMV